MESVRFTTIREKYHPDEGEAPDWDYDLPETGSHVIITKGCDCCTEKYVLTPELLAEAIEDAENWLLHLKSIQP